MPAAADIASLAAALERGELLYHYQPKVSMVLGGISGAEALLRWRLPDGTLRPPSEFIPLAESTGFITQITLGMLGRLVADVAAIRATAPGLLVSFNASARDFEDDRLVDAIVGLLDRGEVAPDELEVELTESAVLAGGASLIERISRLPQRGVRLAMDDFGTGYSGLDTLARLPFTTLKIDQGIVGRMESSEKEATIVASSVRLAHRLGLDIVAEGIETEQTFLHLQAAGCSTAQGYWLGRPMPLQSFLDLLGAGRRWPAGALGLVHMAMLDHLEWRKALIDELLAARPGVPQTQIDFRGFALEPTECRLGRWYHGPGRALVSSAAYRALAEPHAALHHHGRSIAEASRRGMGLAELVPSLRRLTELSTVIISLLQELEHAALTCMVDQERVRIQPLEGVRQSSRVDLPRSDAARVG